jgi:hypothetical protein
MTYALMTVISVRVRASLLVAVTFISACSSLATLGWSRSRASKRVVPIEWSSPWPPQPGWSDLYTYQLDRFEGDKLLATMTYKGGCGPHDFKVIAGPFKESWPVQVGLYVWHKSEDGCGRTITEEVVIDLRPLKEKHQQTYSRSTGEIRLLGRGLVDNDVYRF